MMNVQIQVAIISGLCVAIPSIITTILSNVSNKKIVNYRIDQLEKHVIAHNNLIDRMYKVENRVTLIEDEIKHNK
jgi:hypothetical protein